MNRSRICRVVLLAVWGMLITLFSGNLTADEKVASDKLLSDLRSAWKARTMRFDSLKFQWKDKTEYHPGSILSPEMATRMGVGDPNANEGWPLKIMEVKSPETLTLRGEWMKYERQAIGPTPDGKSIKRTDYVSGYDGKSSRMMFSDPHEVSGSIRLENSNTDSAVETLRPLMFFARPFDSDFGRVDPASLKFLDQDRRDGLLMVEANALRRFVIDPKRDFLILSWVQIHPNFGGNLFEGQITYRKHENLGWIPSGWQWEKFAPRDADTVEVRHTAKVTNAEAGVKYKQSDFHIKFPIGARVYDHHIRREYVIEPDGSKRDVTLGR